MSTDIILVTGATGKTGRRVAKLLEEAGHSVRAVSRKSDIPFDWHDERTWNGALEGTKSIYVVHPELGSPHAALQVCEFAKFAAKLGATKAILVSTPEDSSEFSRSMRDAEHGIIDAGLSLTSLRLRWFNQNFSEDFLLDPVISRELRMPAGLGKEAFVDADDIAEVAATVLTEASHNGRYYELTGPRLLSFADIAEEISALTEQPIRYVPLTPDAYVSEQIAVGVPEEWARSFSDLYQDIANHKLESVSGDIERVLGKPARDFRDYAAKIAASGVWTANRQI